MDIQKELIDDLNAVVKVKVGPSDYTDRVENALRTYQKRVSMPGFRPGKVPAPLVRKMYHKTVMAEEMNRILSDSIYNYIRENNLEVLGNPLPKEEVNNNVDFDNQKEFEFHFDMALAPKFELSLGPDMEFHEYTVRIDDKLIEGYVTDLTRRYGNITPVDAAADGDLIYGDFVELDANGEIVPGGIFKSSTMFLDNPAKENQKELIGAKAGDKFDLEPSQLADSPRDIAAKLGIDEAAAAALKNKFRFTVKSISRLIPAELNQELFDKVYGAGVVNSVEEFRARIADELSKMFVRDAEQRLRNDITNGLLARVNMNLPDEFLKRWLLVANEKPITLEQLEAEYPMYARQLRWQLIENKLIRDNDIKVTPEDATEHVKNILRENFAKYGRSAEEISDKELEETAARVLAREDEAKRVYEDLYGQKLMTVYRMKCKISPKEVSYEEFLAG
ncbi:MAG: trigger factor [Bacteroidia bacterium]